MDINLTSNICRVCRKQFINKRIDVLLFQCLQKRSKI